MEIIFLGTSGCVPTKERNLPGLVIRYLGEPYLFDPGEGTQRQMTHSGVSFMKIDHIFITHLHADHFLGLGGMIQSMDFLERTRELNIYGPKGLKGTIDNLLTLGTFVLENFRINVHEIGAGKIYENNKVRVTCARTIHTKNSIAYCFEEKAHRKFLKQKALDLGIPEGRLFSKLQGGETVEYNGKKVTPDQVLSDPVLGRKVVYTGDTKPAEDVIKLAKNADVLIHEATIAHEDVESMKDMFHSTTKQAAEVAKKANAGKLFLVHISQRYTEPDKLEKEAREIFKESYVASDLMKVKVEKHW